MDLNQPVAVAFDQFKKVSNDGRSYLPVVLVHLTQRVDWSLQVDQLYPHSIFLGTSITYHAARRPQPVCNIVCHFMTLYIKIGLNTQTNKHHH